MRKWPALSYKEEGMREGMQIEDANIPVEDKVRLLDALSETGLKNIVVGAFVSPKYTPQMARIDDLVQKFHPKPGVTYTALALNEQGIERAKKYSPPLTVERSAPRLFCHMCDVFVRRNTNRSQDDEIARWPQTVAGAKQKGVKEAGIGVNASWGSNFVGQFSLQQRMDMLGRQHALWDEANIKVTQMFLGDPMSWCMPHVVEETIEAIKKKWPDIKTFTLHLHNGRGMAITSAYAALRVMDSTDKVELDGTIGGIGGCPYCGNGRTTGMMPTEDAIHLFEEMGINTGISVDKLIDCVWMLEDVLGRSTMGHVSKAGPFPKTKDKWYDPNMPFVETHEQARHFKLGPSVYQGGIYPWKEKIRSTHRPDTLKD